MDKDRVSYMLSLGKKKRENTISEKELLLLGDLRREYLADFREGFSQQLDHVYIQQEDGSQKKLERKQSQVDQDPKASC